MKNNVPTPLTSSVDNAAQADAAKRPSWLQHAVVALRKRTGPQGFVFVVAAVLGVATGICAAVLKLMIGWMARLVRGVCIGGGEWWPLLVVPVVGIVLTGLFQRYVVRVPLGHGLSRISAMLAKGKTYMQSKLMYAWMVASTLTLGFGGSAGSEGPIASTGAALGSNLGRRAGLDDSMLRVLIGCGAGAGIAGIFKAPIGGFLFTLEVMRLRLSTMTVMAVLTSCLISAMTAYALSGFTVDLSYVQMAQFEPHTILWIVALGVICGFYSLYYEAVMNRMERFYNGIRRPLLRNVVSGAVLAVLLFAFPSLYGEGYGVLTGLLNGNTDIMVRGEIPMAWRTWTWLPVAIAGGIVVVKAFACSATNCGGGVAGDFAPTLFAGCMLGFVFGSLAQGLCGADIPVAGFAFIGMAGVMAGVIRAPFMAIFLCAEMCNGFVLLLPLLAVSAISFGVVRIFKPARLYHPQ